MSQVTVTIYVCDFCGQQKDSNRHLTTGMGNEKHICDVCAKVSAAMLREAEAVEGGLEKGAKVINFNAQMGPHHVA